MPMPMTIDPTENVKALNEASVSRLDDLMRAFDLRFTSEIGHLHEIVNQHASHASELRRIETDRLASIRQVDLLNQSTAADRQQTAIGTLERSTQTNSETLRAMVDATAKTLAAQNAAQMLAVEARLAALERSSYEDKGKQTVTDPQLEKFYSLVESLRGSRDNQTGKGLGISALWGWIVGGLGLLFMIYNFISNITAR